MAERSRPGFRLARFEVLNWGTFNERVWKIEPNGENALLTGDIGSGKSTLVDAITTLLVPPRKIAYNKAAGAEAKERSLASYVRGEYRSVSNELTGGAQAQALRGESSYSVILGVFEDGSRGRAVTGAQVFWLREGERNPSRLYLVADGPLAITEHFSGFGADIQNLRKRLRADRQVTLFDSFEEYGARLRRELGIPHAQALDLFYQTVSMKSVGNLTDFVRRHMLETDDTGERIGALISNFGNLNHAHDAIVRARDQIERLAPLVADGDRLEELDTEIAILRRARDALAAWFSGHRARLLARKIEDLEFEKRKLEQRIEQYKTHLADLSRQRGDLRAAIELQGGGRIREIDADIARKQIERGRQQADEQDYRKLCVALGLKPGTTLETFLAASKTSESRQVEIETEKQRLDRLAIDKAVEFREIGGRDKELSNEIQSLKGRTSNIPADGIRIRDALAEALNVDPADLPFAGELLRVRPDEAAWEGAIERLLRGFGLSLLVPEALYAQVSHYVDRTHLRGRIVYLRVPEQVPRSSGRSTSPQSVVRKLGIKPEAAAYPFLQRELAEHFDYACCESLEEFRRLPRAITLNGLIKANERRHEKTTATASTSGRATFLAGTTGRSCERFSPSRTSFASECWSSPTNARNSRKKARLANSSYAPPNGCGICRIMRALTGAARRPRSRDLKTRSVNWRTRTISCALCANRSGVRRRATRLSNPKRSRQIANSAATPTGSNRRGEITIQPSRKRPGCRRSRGVRCFLCSNNGARRCWRSRPWSCVCSSLNSAGCAKLCRPG